MFGGGLYIASWMTPATNELFQKFGAGAQKNVMYSSLNPSANPFTGLFAAASHIGLIGFILIGAILISVGYLLKKKERSQLQNDATV